MTPNELISIAANNLGDGGFVSLNREEYIGFVNDVGHDIWMDSKAMHRIRHYALPEDERSFVLPDTDVIEFAELQVRAKETIVNDPEPEILEEGVSATHQEEKPVHQNIRQGRGIWTNVGNVHTHYHLTPEFRDGQYIIQSPQPFLKGQVLHAHCIIHSDRYAWLDAAQVDPTTGKLPNGDEFEESLATSIWEPFRNVFIEGVLWRAARRLSNFTQDPARYRIWKDSQSMYYSTYLPKAIHFIHSLKDGTASLHVEPFQYLPER